MAAIKLLKKLEKEGRNPSPEEKRILTQYVGWGGLKNVFDSSRAKARGKAWQEDKNWTEKWGDKYDTVKSLLTEDEWNKAAASTLNAHYTEPPTEDAVWRIAEKLGFRGGRMLDPFVDTTNLFEQHTTQE